jgi:hypothetical protein
MTKNRDWLSPKAEERSSSIDGAGIFAKEPIRRGEKVIILKGNYTNSIGAEKAKKEGLFVLQWDDDLYSYEIRGDDNGYSINHSCNSNLWMDDAYTFTARRDIQKGEELTIDYALFAEESYISKWSCKCKTKQCRKRVTGMDWKNPSIQQQYQNHFSPFLNKKIAKLRVFTSANLLFDDRTDQKCND